MHRYLAKRLLLAIPTVLGVTLVVFLAVKLLPGDVVESLAGDFGATPEFRKAIEERYSLNQGVVQQYFKWLGETFTGDLGSSIITSQGIAGTLRTRIVPTLELGIIALLVALAIAIPIGVLSAIRQDTLLDYIARSFAIGLLATPSFWIAIMAIIYGFIIFGWTPPLGYQQPWEDPISNLKTLWVPALILGTHITGSVMRLTRSTMLEVLRQDYVRTAWAKGLRERVIVVRHALRNALLPVVTVLGVQVPVLISGTVILEYIFSVPGMGSWYFSSIQQRDYPVVQAVVLLTALMVVASNLIVDIAYSFIDPRIRYA